MRGLRYYAAGQLPSEIYDIPGVRIVKGGKTQIPWHAYHLVQRLVPDLSARSAYPEQVPTPLEYVEDPVRAHPFASTASQYGATKYQREDLARALRLRGGLIDWPCVTGDAEVVVNRGGCARRMRLDELVRKFNGAVTQGGSGSKRRWDLSIPTRTRVMDSEGRIRLGIVVQAIESGVKPVYQVTVESGRQIKTTLDHVFLRPGGGESPLSALAVGDHVLLVQDRKRQGRGRITDGTRQHYEVVTAVPLHPHASRWMRSTEAKKTSSVQSYMESRVPKHRIVYEAYYLNRLSVEEYIRRIKAGQLDGLSFVDPSTHEVDHIDRNSRNNDPSNLQLLTITEHRQKTADADGAAKNVLFQAGPEVITDIECVGEEPTYDLVMSEPNRNFIANDFVVHNCGSGKTLLGLLFASAFPGYRAVVIVPSTTVLQWRDQAHRWLDTSTIRVGYVATGAPQIKRRKIKIWEIDGSIRAKLRKYPGTETLRLRDRWAEDEVSLDEAGLLRKIKAPAEIRQSWILVDDSGVVLGEYQDSYEAKQAAGVWVPSDEHDIIIVSWGLMSNPVVKDALLRWKPAVLVIDEAHRGKSHRRFRAVKVRGKDGEEETKFERLTSAAANIQHLSLNVGACLLLTATPQADLPRDWWGVLDLYDPFAFGNFHTWSVRHCAGHQGKFSWDSSGLSRIDELKERLALIRMHRTKADTHAELPKLRRMFTTLDLRQAGQVNFEALGNELRAGDLGGSPTAMGIAVACEQKIPWAVDRIAEYLREGLRVVAFTLLRTSATRLHQELLKAIPDGLVLHGDGMTAMRDRQLLVQELTTSTRGGVLVGTIGAWGEAIDGLQKVDRALVLTVPWTPRMVQQMEGRFERLGGDRSVIVEYVRMAGTLDDKAWAIVGDKLVMVGDVRDDIDARQLGDELQGKTPDAEAEALRQMAALLVAWDEEQEERGETYSEGRGIMPMDELD